VVPAPLLGAVSPAAIGRHLLGSGLACRCRYKHMMTWTTHCCRAWSHVRTSRSGAVSIFAGTRPAQSARWAGASTVCSLGWRLPLFNKRQSLYPMPTCTPCCAGLAMSVWQCRLRLHLLCCICCAASVVPSYFSCLNQQPLAGAACAT
jgi:hypothetical protein